MDAASLIAMARNPRNVVGIFKYCDRWCERCAFTDRCLQYQTQSTLPDGGADDAATRQALEFVSREFGLGFELFAGKMAEFGIHLRRDGRLTSCDADTDAAERLVRNHRIVHAGRAYAALVSAWFDAERQALMARADHLVARADRADAGEALVTEAVHVKQALEIIEHDRWFITPKLSRALRNRAWHDAHPEVDRDPVQNDSNGFAKVALISIERSEAAWRMLAEWMDGSPTAMLLAQALAELRAQVDKEFPAARRFVRPGFDHASV